MAFVSLFFPLRNAIYSLTFGLRFLCLLTTIHNFGLGATGHCLRRFKIFGLQYSLFFHETLEAFRQRY